MRSGKNQLRKRKPRFLKLRKTRMQIIISIKCIITVTVTKLRCLMSIKNYTTQNDKYEYPHQRAVFHILPWLLHDSLKRLVSTRCKLRRLVPNDRITVHQYISRCIHDITTRNTNTITCTLAMASSESLTAGGREPSDALSDSI
jgi:hypothetical protein